MGATDAQGRGRSLIRYIRPRPANLAASSFRSKAYLGDNTWNLIHHHLEIGILWVTLECIRIYRGECRGDLTYEVVVVEMPPKTRPARHSRRIRM